MRDLTPFHPIKHPLSYAGNESSMILIMVRAFGSRQRRYCSTSAIKSKRTPLSRSALFCQNNSRNRSTLSRFARWGLGEESTSYDNASIHLEIEHGYLSPRSEFSFSRRSRRAELGTQKLPKYSIHRHPFNLPYLSDPFRPHRDPRISSRARVKLKTRRTER